MTFDTHLINEALVALGIAAGIAVLMALAIIGIATAQLRHKASRGKPTAVPADATSPQNAREHEPQAA